MKIFYFLLFAAVGIFCVLAAVRDWKWFIDCWAQPQGRPSRRLKSRNVLRFLIGAAGVALILFGTAALAGWI